jgi:hypothetical protein
MGLPLKTWLLFFVWLVAGLLLYFTFSRKNVGGALQNPSHT